MCAATEEDEPPRRPPELASPRRIVPQKRSRSAEGEPINQAGVLLRRQRKGKGLRQLVTAHLMRVQLATRVLMGPLGMSRQPHLYVWG